jgi:hypothetical protein
LLLICQFWTRASTLQKRSRKRSYLIGARIDPAKAPDGMLIGTGQKYRSIRATPTDDGGTLLLIGEKAIKLAKRTTPQNAISVWQTMLTATLVWITLTFTGLPRIWCPSTNCPTLAN